MTDETTQENQEAPTANAALPERDPATDRPLFTGNGVGFSRNVWSAKLSVGRSTSEVSTPFMRGDVKDQFLSALSDIARQVERNIVIQCSSHYPRCVDEQLLADSLHRNIYLHPFSTPKGITVQISGQLPEVVTFKGVDYEVSGCQRDVLVYDMTQVKDSLVVQTDPDENDNQCVLAIFKSHHIYLMADLFDSRGGAWAQDEAETAEGYSDRTDARILESCQLILEVVAVAVEHMKSSGMLLDYEKVERARIDDAHKQYEALYPALVSAQVTTKRTMAERHRREAETYIQSYAVELEAERKCRLELEAIENGLDKDLIVGSPTMFFNLMKSYWASITFAREYENSYGDIQRDGAIIAISRTIYIKHKGDETNDEVRVFMIGRVQLVIPLDPTKRIQADNLDRPRAERGGEVIVHPHMTASHVCLGNLEESIAQLRTERSIMVLLQVLAQYLYTYNPGSPYNRIGLYPDVTDSFDDDELIIYDNTKKIGESQQQEGIGVVEIVRRNAGPVGVNDG